ncbi:MAG TPA: hypothetical protein VGV92_00485 [Gammaproteobacteria bacterium]|nr:hypothetical protein [Gammaproteobacteria bacterium]
MLLLMRREGEAVRINENITMEIKKISEEAVEFILQGISEDQIKLVADAKENTRS